MSLMIANPVAPASSMSNPSSGRRYALHGYPLELDIDPGPLAGEVERVLGEFAVSDLPDGFNAIRGSVRPYDQAEVAKHLSPTAVPFADNRALLELYHEGERFWLIDDRWGMVELNLVKGTWKAWVLPTGVRRTDNLRLAEMAALWPMAQLLRPRGLHLLPAAAVAKDGVGMLILAPFGIEPELVTLLRHGYKLIAQRWVAIREDDGKLALLHLPGIVERSHGPRFGGSAGGVRPDWVDLEAEHLSCRQHHAFLSAAVVIQPGRHPDPRIRELAAVEGLDALRRAWPIVELHPQRRQGMLAARMLDRVRITEVELSRDPQDLVRMLDRLTRPAPTVTIEMLGPVPQRMSA